jgi:hypothetical protein
MRYRLWVIIREFVREVERRAEQKMLLTGKLEGAHYAAMKELLAELEKGEGNENNPAR